MQSKHPTPPARLRPARSMRVPLAVAAYGAVLAIALVFGCSSESSPEPPRLGDCVPRGTVRCPAFLSSGLSQVNGGGATGGNGGAGSSDGGGGGGSLGE
jgi:hypothetical protein